MLIVGKILAALLLPPGIFILLMALGVLLILRGRRRAAALILGLSAVLLYGAATKIVSSALLRPLEDSYPPLAASSGARAIVVLGGGYMEFSPEYGGAPALSPDSEKRAVYGLELSRKYGLPMIFSGGRGYDSEQSGNEAEAAGRLWLALGLPQDRIALETQSKDTRGNAEGVLRMAGRGPFILVTTAVHMPRAVLAFRKAGISVMAAPTDYRAKRTPISFSDFLPSSSCLADSSFALHEYIGLIYYRMT
jgi:uncharacterized SAM-binding protein YcdF (DUF218 family)